MSERIPDYLPELRNQEVVDYLQFANYVLRSKGVEDLLQLDYSTKKQALLQLRKANRSHTALAKDITTELENVENFHNSKLPLALLTAKLDRRIMIDLVKVDDFGQVYANYAINLLSFVAFNPYVIRPSINGYDVSSELCNAALVLCVEQEELGWSPYYELNDSSAAN